MYIFGVTKSDSFLLLRIWPWTVLGPISGLTIPIMRAAFSKHTAETEQGVTMALVASMETLSMLIGPIIFNQVGIGGVALEALMRSKIVSVSVLFRCIRLRLILCHRPSFSWQQVGVVIIVWFVWSLCFYFTHCPRLLFNLYPINDDGAGTDAPKWSGISQWRSAQEIGH